MTLYHKSTEHKNYLILHQKIISEGLYWNNIALTCKEFVKKYEICNMKNKCTFMPPTSHQILCSNPKELYLIDLTELPVQFSNNNNNSKLYLVILIDHFSKYAGTYLINNKKQEAALKK